MLHSCENNIFLFSIPDRICRMDTKRTARISSHNHTFIIQSFLVAYMKRKSNKKKKYDERSRLHINIHLQNVTLTPLTSGFQETHRIHTGNRGRFCCRITHIRRVYILPFVYNDHIILVSSHITERSTSN